MSKIMLITGLILSTAAHIWLLGIPNNFAVPKTGETPAATAKQQIKTETVEIQELPNPARLQAVKQESKTAQVEPQQESKAADQQEHEEAEPIKSQSSSPQYAESESEGDFAGSKDGIARAGIRIDWGSPRRAAEVLSSTGMKLVILKEDQSFGKELSSVNGVKWSLQNFSCPPQVRYSTALRVVDRVPAFSAALKTASLSPGEHLAVMLPENVESAIRTSGYQAATAGGLSENAVATIGGRFESVGDNVGFIVTHIQPRSGQ